MNKMSNVVDLFKLVMKRSTFGKEDFPVKYNLVEEKEKKLIIVIGDNASGKSLLTSQLLNTAKKHFNISGYNMSMNTRTTEKDGGVRAFMYDTENDNSTGAISVSAVIQGLNHCLSNAQKGSDMMLLLDEPTLGLSSRYEKAMGKYIIDLVKENDSCEYFKGLLLVTHSKDMVRSILESGFEPSVISVNSNINLKEWLKNDDSASIEELLSLKKLGLERWRELNSYFKNN